MPNDQNNAKKAPMVAVLWPDEGNYARFCAISADLMPPTLAEFRQAILRRISQKRLAEANLVKIAFDPDELARWCRANGRPVDTHARAHFAALAVKDALDGRDENRAGRRGHH